MMLCMLASYSCFYTASGTQIPKDGVSMTATCLAAGLMIIAIYLLRSVTHGVHAWLVGRRGK